MLYEASVKIFVNFRNWSCPENANKDLVKTLNECGFKLGECKAEKKCIEKENRKDVESKDVLIKKLKVRSFLLFLIYHSQKTLLNDPSIFNGRLK